MFIHCSTLAIGNINNCYFPNFTKQKSDILPFKVSNPYTICPVCMSVEIMIEAISTFTNISIDLPWKLLLVLSILGSRREKRPPRLQPTVVYSLRPKIIIDIDTYYIDATSEEKVIRIALLVLFIAKASYQLQAYEFSSDSLDSATSSSSVSSSSVSSSSD